MVAFPEALSSQLLLAIYGLLAVLIGFQLCRICYYQTKFKSFRTGFLAIYLVAASLRVVFWLSADLHSWPLPLSTSLYFIPHACQVSTYSLILLYYVRVLENARWRANRGRYILLWSLISMLVVVFVLGFALTIGSLYIDDPQEQEWKTRQILIDAYYTTMAFIYFVMVCMSIYHLVVIFRRNDNGTGNTPKLPSTTRKELAITSILFILLASRMGYHAVGCVDRSDSSHFRSFIDIDKSISWLTFSLFILWEILPSIIILVYFRNVSTTRPRWTLEQFGSQFCPCCYWCCSARTITDNQDDYYHQPPHHNPTSNNKNHDKHPTDILNLYHHPSYGASLDSHSAASCNNSNAINTSLTTQDPSMGYPGNTKCHQHDRSENRGSVLEAFKHSVEAPLALPGSFSTKPLVLPITSGPHASPSRFDMDNTPRMVSCAVPRSTAQTFEGYQLATNDQYSDDPFLPSYTHPYAGHSPYSTLQQPYSYSHSIPRTTSPTVLSFPQLPSSPATLLPVSSIYAHPHTDTNYLQSSNALPTSTSTPLHQTVTNTYSQLGSPAFTSPLSIPTPTAPMKMQGDQSSAMVIDNTVSVSSISHPSDLSTLPHHHQHQPSTSGSHPVRDLTGHTSPSPSSSSRYKAGNNGRRRTLNGTFSLRRESTFMVNTTTTVATTPIDPSSVATSVSRVPPSSPPSSQTTTTSKYTGSPFPPSAIDPSFNPGSSVHATPSSPPNQSHGSPPGNNLLIRAIEGSGVRKGRALSQNIAVVVPPGSGVSERKETGGKGTLTEGQLFRMQWMQMDRDRLMRDQMLRQDDVEAIVQRQQCTYHGQQQHHHHHQQQQQQQDASSQTQGDSQKYRGEGISSRDGHHIDTGDEGRRRSKQLVASTKNIPYTQRPYR